MSVEALQGKAKHWESSICFHKAAHAFSKQHKLSQHSSAFLKQTLLTNTDTQIVFKTCSESFPCLLQFKLSDVWALKLFLMSEACESSTLLVTAALKHYLSSLHSSVFNFFKSCLLSSQTLITALTFSFSKHLTVMSVRNCSNVLMILKSFSSLLSESFSAAEICETSALTNVLYKVLCWVCHFLHFRSIWCTDSFIASQWVQALLLHAFMWVRWASIAAWSDLSWT